MSDPIDEVTMQPTASWPAELAGVDLPTLVLWVQEPSKAPEEARPFLRRYDVRRAVYEAAKRHSGARRRRGGVIA